MAPNDIVRLVRELEDEVNNGGFHQFFYNSAGDDAVETIDALDAIHANAMADILRRAVARFPGDIVPKDRYARQEVLPDPPRFFDLDLEFYAYPDDLASLLAEYKRRTTNS